MTELATLGLSIRSDGVVVATDRLKDFEGAGRRAEGVAGSLMRTAVALGTALAGAFSIRALGGYADAWSDMQSRVGSAIKSMEAAPALMQRITDIANASYSPLQQTNEIFGRNVTVLGALGRSATEAADFTEALNHALVTTATKGQDADVVLNSLSRAISNNTLRAMEFETIMSRSPRVLEAIAEEMGTNVIGLRALATQGKVTGKIIVDSMINSLEKLRGEAGEMPATLRDAAMIWNNVFNEVVGRVDQAWQATGRLASASIELAVSFRGTADNLIRVGNIVGSVLGPAFDMLGANMGSIASVAGIAVAALAGFYAPAMIGGLWSLSAALVTGVAGGIKAITLAMMANPLGLLIAGLAAAVTAAFMFRDEIKQAIGVDVVQVFRDGANMVIGAMVGAVNASQAAWGVFPDFMAGLGARAWNSFLEGFEGSAISWTNPFTGEKFDLLNIDLSTFKKDVGGAGGAAVAAVTQAFQSAQGVDYVGALSNSLGDVWANAEGATGAMAGLLDTIGGGGGPGAGGAGTGKESPYAKIVRGALEFISAQQLEQQALGMTAEAAQRLRFEQDLLNKAANDNITLTPVMRDELTGLAAQMAATEAQTRMLTQAANDNAAIWGQAQDGVSGIIKTWARGGDILDTISNKLLGIGDMLVDMAVRDLFGAAFGGGNGAATGGGGILGFLGSLFGMPSFDGGGSTGSGARSGGIDGRGGFPAILHPNETVIDHTRAAANQGQQVSVHVTVGIATDGNGNITPFVQKVARTESRQASAAMGSVVLQQANKSAPASIAKYQRDEAGSDYRLG